MLTGGVLTDGAPAKPRTRGIRRLQWPYGNRSSWTL